MLKNFEIFLPILALCLFIFKKYNSISVLFWKMLKHLTAATNLSRVSTLPEKMTSTIFPKYCLRWIPFLIHYCSLFFPALARLYSVVSCAKFRLWILKIFNIAQHCSLVAWLYKYPMHFQHKSILAFLTFRSTSFCDSAPDPRSRKRRGMRARIRASSRHRPIRITIEGIWNCRNCKMIQHYR